MNVSAQMNGTILLFAAISVLTSVRYGHPSPEGKIAFVSDRAGSPQIYLLEVRSRRERRLTYRGSYNASPAWSPDGDWIVYAAQTGSSFDLYLIDPQSGYTTPLVVHPRSDEDPAWSPDGRKIIFSSSRRAL